MAEEISSEQIQKMVDKIGLLDPCHHIAIAAILKEEGNVKINENQSGLMVNMSLVSAEVVLKIQNFLDFIAAQESQLKDLEDRKEECKLMF
jgi:hypothetical protein